MHRGYWILFLLGLAVLPGCYGAKLFRQPVTVDETARDLEAIRQQQASLEQRLQALERRLAEQSELLRQIKAEESLHWEDLETRLLSIDSRFREVVGDRPGYSETPIWSANADRKTTRESEPIAPLVQIPADAAAQGDPAQPGSAGAGTDIGDAASSGPGPQTPAAGADSVPAAAGAAAAKPEAPAWAGAEVAAKRVYDQAYLDLTRGNYSLAVLGFREFLRMSPASDLGDNAQYWIGECFYAQRDFHQAIQEFLLVEENYSQGDKVAAALLKAGYSFLQLEDRASARRYLNEVVNRFPNSDEAGLARAKLRAAG